MLAMAARMSADSCNLSFMKEPPKARSKPSLHKVRWCRIDRNAWFSHAPAASGLRLPKSERLLPGAYVKRTGGWRIRENAGMIAAGRPRVVFPTCVICGDMDLRLTCVASRKEYNFLGEDRFPELLTWFVTRKSG